MDAVQEELHKEKHARYFKTCLGILPYRLVSIDTTRLSIIYFSLSGLDLLGEIDSLTNQKQQIIDWIYGLQIQKKGLDFSGFRGSTTYISNFLMPGHTGEKEEELCCDYDCTHIAMTYTGIASLLILGDDLSKINKAAILEGVKSLQLPSGSFLASKCGEENDMRFVYCAVSICYMLQNWSAINIDGIISYIRSCMTYDNSIGMQIGGESHGGFLYCAVASLVMMDKLHDTFSQQEIDMMIKWCVMKQNIGFHGRTEKEDDTCYAFWIGATLKMLGGFHLFHHQKLKSFVLSNQDGMTGGLGKYKDSPPDPLHTYLGIAGLSLLEHSTLLPLNPALNVSTRASNCLN